MINLKDTSLLRQQCFINGTWCDADVSQADIDKGLNATSINVTNPATNTIIGTVPKMGTVETRRAIEAANAAQPTWRAKTAGERAKILRKWYELMLANQEDLV